MPYVIHRPSKRRRALAVASAGLLTWLGAAGMAATPAMADTASCSDPVLTQPFTASNDQNYYTLVPGESPDNFDGGGWTLTGGASVLPTTLADGSSGSVLDLPSGSMAVSPPVCVNSSYTSARAMVSDVAGLGAVLFSVSYQGTDIGPGPQNNDGPSQGPGPGDGPSQGPGSGARWLRGAGPGGGWSLSNPLQLNPPNVSGWTIARFRFISLGTQDSDFQLYDFYVDPYSRG